METDCTERTKPVKMENQAPVPDYCEEWLPSRDCDKVKEEDEDPATPIIDEVFTSNCIKIETLEDADEPRTLTSKPRINCSECSSWFIDQVDLEIHLVNCHFRSRRYKCATCLKEFNKPLYLRTHIRAVHLRIKPYKCDICDKSFAHFGSLQYHKSTPHIIPKSDLPVSKLYCKECERSFASEKSLQVHRGHAHTNKRFKCHFCEKIFKRRNILKKHISGCDNIRASTLPDLTGFKAKLDDAATIPEGKVEEFNEPRINCPKCSSSFINQQDLEIHLITIHLHPKPFRCLTCSKEFRCQSALRKHINAVHLRLKPYKCDKCDKSFANRGGLNLHEATLHNNPTNPTSKMFSCKKCQATFATRSLMAHHERRVHTYAPPPQKSRSEASALSVSSIPKPSKGAKYIVKLENGENVMECKLCPYKFKSFDIYKKHIKPVHSLNSAFCVDCGYSSAYKINVDNHIRVTHKSVKVEATDISNEYILP